MIAKIILIVINLIGLGIAIGKDGEKKTGKHSGWYSLVAMIIVFTIYYYAGIFDL